MRFDLTPMLKPKSVAIIGASRDAEKVGHVVLQNYVNAGYDGKLYAVNKNADEVMGFKAYKSVLDIKEPVDLAVVAIPAPFVPQALDECGRAKIKTAIVISGGFAEVGNTELQEKMVAVANKHKIALLGPNCLGVMDPRSRVDTLFLPTYKLSRPSIGGVSFVTQSGAVGSTILDMISGEGFGLSKFISYGNAAQIDEVDILEYLMHDNDTKVIVLYIEGIKRGKEFVEIARKITKVKPVVVLKAGRTAAGMVAAHSHTAALAGDYQAHEAVFRQFGFTIANDLSEVLAYAKILSAECEAKGNRVAVLTNGGGAGVLVTDAIASTSNLRLAELSDASKKTLQKVMPPIVNLVNPLDMAGDADDKRYNAALSIMKDDPGIDMVIAISLFQTPGADSKVAATLIHYKETFGRPLIVMSVGASYTQMHITMMESAGVPVYESPAIAVASLSELLKYYQYKNRR